MKYYEILNFKILLFVFSLYNFYYFEYKTLKKIQTIMGCTDSKHQRPNLTGYFSAYSFDNFLVRELEENDLANGEKYKIFERNIFYFRLFFQFVETSL